MTTMDIFHFLGMAWVVLGTCVFTALIIWLICQGLHRVIERMEIGREFEEKALSDQACAVTVFHAPDSAARGQR